MKKAETDYNFLYLLPIALIISVIPFIVYLKRIQLTEHLLNYWKDLVNWDYYAYYKMIWLIIITIIAIISLFIYITKGSKLKKTYYYIPLGIYSIFIILSSVSSKYQEVAFWGFPDRYEGMFTLLSYVMITFITINLVNSKKDIKILLGFLLTSASILGIVGIFQYFKLDILSSTVGQRLFLPEDLHYLAGNITSQWDSDNIIYFLYNPNYVGSYMAMLFTFSLVLYLLLENKRQKLLIGAFSVLIFANLLGSTSRAGLVGTFCAVIFLILLLRKRIVENQNYIIGILLCFILVFGIMDYGANGTLSSQLFYLNLETKQIEVSKLEDIKINGNKLTIITETEVLDVVTKQTVKGRSLNFYDGNGKKLSYSSNKYPNPYKNSQYIYAIKLYDMQYKNYNFVLAPEDNILQFKYDKKTANFKVTETGFWAKGIKGNLYRTKEVESWGFENRERLGSGRGFIWSRSLPLLKDTIFTGYGADNFALYFPQRDYVGKLKTFGTFNILVDKPHDMYLQIALNTGVISLLAVLTLFISYFFSSIKLYWNNNWDNLYAIVGAGILVAFVGYAVTAIFNDSVVSVAPVFWALLGMGISINLQLRDVKSEDY